MINRHENTDYIYSFIEYDPFFCYKKGQDILESIEQIPYIKDSGETHINELTREKGRNMGHGILKFKKPCDATLVLLNYQGIKLGDKNIILTEAFKNDHLKQKKHICNVIPPSSRYLNG
ncbi:RNA binding protein [Plasmodium falciparum RAJ116]|uniref:RNA binding protein n=1 Tax=Plasmodium falciparum RAJ116 TaxID=580058 RepID=A0A0L0D0E4_PLAFA|nr:RNA binding protein [Plasmodium falciparum RAJ116]